MQWIIDGNNLIHRIPALQRQVRLDADGARQGLIALVGGLIGTPEVESLVVVFDGRGDHVIRESALAGVTRVYSPSHLTADAVIEQWVRAAPDPGRCCVVTSDRLERDSVRAAGADSMACGDFIEWMATRQRTLGQWLQRRRSSTGASLADFFPSAGSAVRPRPEDA